jgi:transposase InsO family protein
LDAGAHAIAYHLTQQGLPAPSPATIRRILTRRGLVAPPPHKRPRSSWKRFQADQPNQRWQADTTHWTLANADEVEVLNLLDDHARLALASTARRVFKAADVLTCVTTAIAAYGLPAAVLTDNGAVFAGGPRGGGRVALEVTLTALGVAVRHARPYHPQTCGKVERFHQTLKQWLARHPRAATTADLQGQLDTFRAYYNPQRPHRALDRRTPPRPTPPAPKPARSVPTPARPRPPPPRHRRHDGGGHPAPRQPPAPHRPGPPPRRHSRAGPRAGPARARHQPRDRPAPPRADPGPNPGLPTTAPTVNDVARHLCTVSRDITVVPLAGLEPATCCLGDGSA